MGFLEYVGPADGLRKDILEIVDYGSMTNAEEGLLERGKRIRTLISKWGPRVSVLFIKKVTDVLKLTVAPVDQGSKPVFPNIDGYDIAAPEMVVDFSNAARHAFIRLDQWHIVNKSVRDLPDRDFVDRFIQTTEALNILLVGLSDSGMALAHGQNRYVFSELVSHPGRLLIVVSNAGDAEHFKGLARECLGGGENTVRYLWHEEILGEDSSGSVNGKDLVQEDEGASTPPEPPRIFPGEREKPIPLDEKGDKDDSGDGEIADAGPIEDPSIREVSVPGKGSGDETKVLSERCDDA